MFAWLCIIACCVYAFGLCGIINFVVVVVVFVVDRRHTNTYWHRNRITFITLEHEQSQRRPNRKKSIQHSLPLPTFVSNDIQLSRQCVTRRLRNEIPFCVYCVATWCLWVCVCVCLCSAEESNELLLFGVVCYENFMLSATTRLSADRHLSVWVFAMALVWVSTSHSIVKLNRRHTYVRVRPSCILAHNAIELKEKYTIKTDSCCNREQCFWRGFYVFSILPIPRANDCDSNSLCDDKYT